MPSMRQEKLKEFIHHQGSPVTEESSMIDYQDTGMHMRDSPEYILQEGMPFFTRNYAGFLGYNVIITSLFKKDLREKKKKNSLPGMEGEKVHLPMIDKC